MARDVAINKEACISCQLCADVLPAVFGMDESGLAEVRDSSGAPEEKIQEIIDACPAACISWIST